MKAVGRGNFGKNSCKEVVLGHVEEVAISSEYVECVANVVWVW